MFFSNERGFPPLSGPSWKPMCAGRAFPPITGRWAPSAIPRVLYSLGYSALQGSAQAVSLWSPGADPRLPSPVFSHQTPSSRGRARSAQLWGPSQTQGLPSVCGYTLQKCLNMCLLNEQKLAYSHLKCSVYMFSLLHLRHQPI